MLTAAWMPMLATAVDFRTALVLIVIEWIVIALVITPSLAYMAETVSFAGAEATAWAVGLLVGPALGGFPLERFDFARLSAGWSLGVIVLTAMVARVARPTN